MTQDDDADVRGFERRRENQTIVLGRRCENQVFQHGKLAVHSLDEFLQTRTRLHKVYASHAITMLEGKHYSFFVLCGEIMMSVTVVNDKWKRRGMCQHICYGRPRCTDEAETQVGC